MSGGGGGGGGLYANRGIWDRPKVSCLRRCPQSRGVPVEGSTVQVSCLCLQEARSMFSRFDKDGNGTISFDEFLQSLRVS